MLPSTKTTLDPRNSFTFGFSSTRPERTRAGRSSFTTGTCTKKLGEKKGESSAGPSLSQLSHKLAEGYLCFGLSPYNLWSNAAFSLFSSILFSQEGKSWPIRNCTRENSRSKGSPPTPTRPTTQAPLRVLRYTLESGQHTESHISDCVKRNKRRKTVGR